jgi:transcription elongation factor Elf1
MVRGSPEVISCPRCGSDNVSAMSRAGSRRPKRVKLTIVRQHVCAECGMEFHSYQVVPSDRSAAEALMDALGLEETA